jgi:hypothetical protein
MELVDREGHGDALEPHLPARLMNAEAKTVAFTRVYFHARLTLRHEHEMLQRRERQIACLLRATVIALGALRKNLDDDSRIGDDIDGPRAQRERPAGNDHVGIHEVFGVEARVSGPMCERRQAPPPSAASSRAMMRDESGCAAASHRPWRRRRTKYRPSDC